MVENLGGSSNIISTDFDDELSIENLLSDLKDWEDQLKDVDFGFCDREQEGEEGLESPSLLQHGGPSPC